jgi:hypothetical protein
VSVSNLKEKENKSHFLVRKIILQTLKARKSGLYTRLEIASKVTKLIRMIL